jgi:3-oxoadipate enol-lactonase
MALHVFDRMVVEDEGEGDAVICVHGLGGSSNSFTPLMPVLLRHRVVRVDLPGSGRSQQAEGALSIQRFVDAVRGACARLGIERAHLVGHSMGTIVYLQLAVQAPALVRSLALFGPLLQPPDAARVALRARADKASTGGVAGMHSITTDLLRVAVSADTRQRQPLAVAFVRESLMRQSGEAYGRTCLALADAQAAAVETLQCPVLLVTGDDDGVAPPQSVRALAQQLHGVRHPRVVILPRCGHWTPVERATECQTELRQFLSTVR